MRFRGWYGDSWRHSLAARGIKTKHKYFKKKNDMKKTDRMLNAIVEVNRDLDERFPVIRGKRVVVERHKIPSDAKLAEEGFEEIVNIKEVPSLGVRMRPVDDEMTEKEKELLDFMSSNRKEIREELDAKRKDLVEKGILPPLKKEKE